MRLDESRYRAQIERDGFAIVERVLDSAQVESLCSAMNELPDSAAVRKRTAAYGVRNLLVISDDVRQLARLAEVRALVEPILGADCFAVRATFFDKLPDANWKLGYHQDSVITVRERRDVEHFKGWSEKSGVVHVQPTCEVMAGMLAVRIHLDDCGDANGPLRVLPGSHAYGWLDDEIDQWKQRVAEVNCLSPAGGALVMRPLLLHASAPARDPAHRRVIHIEYAFDDLPGGLQWRDRVGCDS